MLATIHTVLRAARGIGCAKTAVDGDWNSRMAGSVGIVPGGQFGSASPLGRVWE